MEDTNFYEVCDCVGEDLEPLAASIIDKDGWIKENICEFDENLMYIDRIYVEEKYRNIGVASFVIKCIEELLEHTVNLNPHVLILLPKPQEKDNAGNLHNIKNEEQKEICMKNLIKLYKKLGFKKIRNSNYMMKKTTFGEMHESINNKTTMGYINNTRGIKNLNLEAGKPGIEENF